MKILILKCYQLIDCDIENIALHPGYEMQKTSDGLGRNLQYGLGNAWKREINLHATFPLIERGIEKRESWYPVRIKRYISFS